MPPPTPAATRSTPSSISGRGRNKVESCDSFECMYLDESKSEVVVSAQLVPVSFQDNIKSNTSSASTCGIIPSISPNSSVITTTCTEVATMSSYYTNAKFSPRREGNASKDTVTDARMEKRLKEDALQRSMNLLGSKSPPRISTPSSLVDLADDESRMTSVFEQSNEVEDMKNDMNNGDDVFDGVTESKALNANQMTTPTKSSTSTSIQQLSQSLSCSSYYEDDDAELTWRLHPSVSLSDWTIEIETKSTGNVITYPVHKSIMAVGPRRSNYFVVEFQNHIAAQRKASADAERAVIAERAAVAERRKVQEAQRTERMLKQQQARDLAAANKKNIVNNPFALLAAGCTLIGAPLTNTVESDSNQDNNRTIAGMNGSPRSVTSFDFDDMKCIVNGDKSKISVPSVTKLQMEELASDAFPFALDFMYSTKGFLDIRTEHATALFWISQKFEIKALIGKVEKFWRTDLTIDTVTTYYKHARVFNDEEITSAAENLFATYLFKLSEDSIIPYLSTFDASFMYNVIEIVVSTMQKQHRKGQSQRRIDTVREGPNDETEISRVPDDEARKNFYFQLSVLIAVYCNIHREIISPSTFWQLTDESFLPMLDAKAAKSLLETQECIVGANHDLTSLTHRCVQVLSNHWNDVLSTQFGTISLLVDEDLGIQTASHRNEIRRGKLATDTNGESSDSSTLPVDVPSLGGVALEEFVALSLRNAKNQISKLQEANISLKEKNEKLERELLSLKGQKQIQSAARSTKAIPGTSYLHNLSASVKRQVECDDCKDDSEDAESDAQSRLMPRVPPPSNVSSKTTVV